MKHILRAGQFAKEDLEKILHRAASMEEQYKEGHVDKLLQDKIVACIFFEPSTRTRLSFETAVLKLGGEVISSENAESNSSAFKGETIEDTSRMLNCYADIIVIRHPKMGTVAKAAAVSSKPVINAGDGANEHPTQALLDLYTIKKEHGKLENISIAFVGDILNSRTLRSLVPLLMKYQGSKFYFVSPKELVLADDYRKFLEENNADFEETNSLEDVLPKIDVLYMTRVQKERFENVADYEKVKDAFLLKIEHVAKLKKDAIIMHPLPRVNEIATEIDNDKRAAYFRQAENGLYVRMAVLAEVLGV